MKKVDLLVVGQGLAGSLMAFTFIKRGLTVHVVNKKNSACSSYVAAGLFNPITGKKRTASWKANTLFPFLLKYYKALETYCGEQLVHELPVYKPFSSIQDQNYWDEYTADHDVSLLAAETGAHKEYSEDIYNDLGGFSTKLSGFLDIPLMLDSFRNQLIKIDAYSEEEFDATALQDSSVGMQYKGIEAKYVVACQGVRLLENSLFEFVPIVPNKGEVLTLSTALKEDKVIYNSGVFVMPRGKNQYRAGSTYTRENNYEPTVAGRDNIEARIRALIRKDYTVVKHEASVRPTTPDRRPVLGKSTSYPSLFVFNGLGTKGVSLGPYFAEQLANYILGEGTLDPEVDCKRFSK